MQVLEQHQHRAPPSEPGELPEQRLERARLERRWGQLGCAVLPLRGDPEQRSEQGHDPRRLVHRAAEHRLQLRQLGRSWVLALQTGRALQVVDDREERGRGVVGRAGEAEHRGSVRRCPLDQRPGEARLPDPGLARDQHRPAAPLARRLPSAEQPAELPPAADQRRQMVAFERVEPALDARLAAHRVDQDGSREALQLPRAEIIQGEETADQAPGVFGDHDLAGAGEGLQARREVRRLADDRLLPRAALADQVAHDDEAGRDADPGREGVAGRRPELRHRTGRFQPCPDRALGRVLVRPGPAEVGEHAVAHELRDVALEARDLARDRVLVGADELAHLLRVEAGRERGRADEVAEQDRQPPPLGLGGAGRGRPLLGGRGLDRRRISLRRATAARSLRRWPIEVTPRPVRSSAVSSRQHLARRCRCRGTPARTVRARGP